MSKSQQTAERPRLTQAAWIDGLKEKAARGNLTAAELKAEFVRGLAIRARGQGSARHGKPHEWLTAVATRHGLGFSVTAADVRDARYSGAVLAIVRAGRGRLIAAGRLLLRELGIADAVDLIRRLHEEGQ